MGLLGIAARSRLRLQRLRLPVPHQAGARAAAPAPPGASTRWCGSRCRGTRSWRARLTELLTGIRTDGGNHDGGTLRIGPDDKLWVSVGRHRASATAAPRGVDQSVLAGPERAQGQDPAPRAGRQPGRRATRSSARRASGRRCTRSGSATRSGWASTPRPAASGRATSARARSRRSTSCSPAATTPGRAARARCPPAASSRATSTRCSSTRTRAAARLGRSVTGGAFVSRSFGVHRRPVRLRRLHGEQALSARRRTPRATTSPPPVDLVTGAGGPVDIVIGPDEALYWVAINTGEVRQARAELPAPEGRHAHAGVARARVTAQCTVAQPHARARARVRVVQPAGAAAPAQLTVGTPDANVACRELGGLRALQHA